MGGNYLSDPAIFVIDTLFSVYIFTVLLRFLLQWTRADFYNPISQFVVKITHPPLKLLRRVVPSIGRIDTSCLVFALLLHQLCRLGINLGSGFSAIGDEYLLLLDFCDDYSQLGRRW